MNNYEALAKMIKKYFEEAKEDYKASGDQYDLGACCAYGSVLKVIKVFEELESES